MSDPVAPTTTPVKKEEKKESTTGSVVFALLSIGVGVISGIKIISDRDKVDKDETKTTTETKYVRRRFLGIF